MDAEQRDALEAIIYNSEWSRAFAEKTGNDFLSYLLELVLLEARAELTAKDFEPPDRGASGRPGPDAALIH